MYQRASPSDTRDGDGATPPHARWRPHLSPVQSCAAQRADTRRMLNAMSSSRRTIAAILALVAASAVALSPTAHAEDPTTGRDTIPSTRLADPTVVAGEWVWPVSGFRILTNFIAPAHRYGPGHRGIDLALFGVRAVRSPAAGVVQFSGRVVDRDLITIDHGNGLVTTLEPVTSPLAVGDRVGRSEEVGVVDEGGHTPAGAVHFGVRWHGEYINPMVLLGGVPRAVLLPCCDELERRRSAQPKTFRPPLSSMAP